LVWALIKKDQKEEAKLIAEALSSEQKVQKKNYEEFKVNFETIMSVNAS
jgi:hypothetical protein